MTDWENVFETPVIRHIGDGIFEATRKTKTMTLKSTPSSTFEQERQETLLEPLQRKMTIDVETAQQTCSKLLNLAESRKAMLKERSKTYAPFKSKWLQLSKIDVNDKSDRALTKQTLLQEQRHQMFPEYKRMIAMEMHRYMGDYKTINEVTDVVEIDSVSDGDDDDGDGDKLSVKADLEENDYVEILVDPQE